MPTTEKHWWNQLLSMGAAVIKKTTLGTAMDSIIIMVALITLPCLIIYALYQFWLLLVIGCIPILQFVRVYDHFMKNNPKMLRTEKHEETMYRIATGLGQKGIEISEKEVDALPATTVEAASTTQKPKLIAPKAKKGKHE